VPDGSKSCAVVLEGEWRQNRVSHYKRAIRLVKNASAEVNRAKVTL